MAKKTQPLTTGKTAKIILCIQSKTYDEYEVKEYNVTKDIYHHIEPLVEDFSEQPYIPAFVYYILEILSTKCPELVELQTKPKDTIVFVEQD